MASRSPTEHAFVPYTGKPYIFFNGIPVDRRPFKEYPSFEDNHNRTMLVRNPQNNPNFAQVKPAERKFIDSLWW